MCKLNDEIHSYLRSRLLAVAGVMHDERRNQLEERIHALRNELVTLEDELERLHDIEQERLTPEHLPLRLDDYIRYGRQMILPDFGLQGD